MTQAQLPRVVARAVGEAIDLLSRHWLERLDRLRHEPDPEDVILDWDRVQLERNVSLFEQ